MELRAVNRIMTVESIGCSEANMSARSAKEFEVRKRSRRIMMRTFRIGTPGEAASSALFAGSHG